MKNHDKNHHSEVDLIVSAQVQCKHGEIITLPLDFLKKFDYFRVLLSERWATNSDEVGANNFISVPEIHKNTLISLCKRESLAFRVSRTFLDLLETVDFLGDERVIDEIDTEIVEKILLGDFDGVSSFLLDLGREYRLMRTVECLERKRLMEIDKVDICVLGGYYHFPLGKTHLSSWVRFPTQNDYFRDFQEGGGQIIFSFKIADFMDR